MVETEYIAKNGSVVKHPYPPRGSGDDHDMLIRIDEKMDMVIERLDRNESCIESVYKRLSVLENFKSTVLGYATAIALVISLAGNWVFSQLGGK